MIIISVTNIPEFIIYKGCGSGVSATALGREEAVAFELRCGCVMPHLVCLRGELVRAV